MTKSTGNIRTKKAVVRRRALTARHALSAEECAGRSKLVCERFLDSDEYRSADTILLYKAYNNEVDTDMVFERAISDGKTVAYPRSAIVDGEPDLKFYVIDDASQLLPGYKGIFEPAAGSAAREFEGVADVCIVPGVAFDKRCHRIGYGKAFYDRYIRMNGPRLVVGFSYDIQIEAEWEPEDSDKAVDMVVTDSEVYIR